MTTAGLGLVGLGNMGGAMAAHWAAAGRSPMGFDLDPRRCAGAAESGLRIASDLAALATGCEVIVLSLPSAGAARTTLDQLAAQSLSPRLVLETSTLGLDDKLDLRERAAAGGHLLLDCPISGTAAQARQKDVTVYVSGDDPEAMSRALALFADIGRPRQVGPFGAGTKLKLLANLLVAIHNASTAECLALAQSAGFDPQVVVDVLSDGAGASRMLQVRGPLMASGEYRPAMMEMGLWGKDLELIADYARSLHARTPLFDAARDLYRTADALAAPDEDTAAVMRALQAD